MLVPCLFMFVGCGKNPPEEFDSKETFMKEMGYIYSESENMLEHAFHSCSGNRYARIAYQLLEGYNTQSYEMYRNNDSGTIVFDSENKEFLTQRDVEEAPSPKEISEEMLNDAIEEILSCKFAFYYDNVIELEEMRFEKMQKSWAGKDRIYFYKDNEDVLTNSEFGIYTISTKTFSFVGSKEFKALVVEYGTYIVEDEYITNTILDDLHDFSKNVKSLVITRNRQLTKTQVLENRVLDSIIFETGHYIFDKYDDSFNIQIREDWIKSIMNSTNIIFVKNDIAIKDGSVIYKYFTQTVSDREGYLKFFKK